MTTSPRNERNFRWGNVTYSDVSQADEAKNFLCSGLGSDELPYNVLKVQLRPIRVESVASEDYTQHSGVKVLVSWFPLHANGIAYIKCTRVNDRDIAKEIVNNLNQQQITLTMADRPAVIKDSGDIAIRISEKDDEFTVKKRLEICCTASQIEGISKITVPSKPFGIDIEKEQEELNEIMDGFGTVRILKLWVANCKKVRACVVFEDLEKANDVILELNGETDILGVRAMYLELESKREVMCDERLYNKIREEINALKNEEINIEVEPRGKRKKIIITGEDPQVSQALSSRMSSNIPTLAIKLFCIYIRCMQACT